MKALQTAPKNEVPLLVAFIDKHALQIAVGIDKQL